MKRLVIWLDTGDSPMPSGSRSVDIIESDMETTRAQAQKIVDHVLQDLTIAQNFRSAVAESVPPEPEPEAAPEPTPEPPGQRNRGERELVTARKGGERSTKKSAKRPRMATKKTARKKAHRK